MLHHNWYIVLIHWRRNDRYVSSGEISHYRYPYGCTIIFKLQKKIKDQNRLLRSSVVNNPQWKTVFLRHLFASTEFSKAQNNSSERSLAALMLKIKDRLKHAAKLRFSLHFPSYRPLFFKTASFYPFFPAIVYLFAIQGI